MKTRFGDRPQRVLVTGGAGYLGSVVVDQLLSRGFKVRVLDALLFGDEALAKIQSHASCEFIRGDVRDTEAVVHAMNGCDTAIHLAGIVGDNACEANRALAIEVNGAATRMVADVAPRCGIRRFLFASSCSVYGSSDSEVRESTKLNPLSLYAETKVDSEKILLGARSRRFSTTVLRLGTLFGVSARMRFDLVVNLLVARAISMRRITIKNGWQWRPFLHVRDAARAFLTCLDCPAESISGQAFNVGADFLNAPIKQIGEIVARMIPHTVITEVHDKGDRRSYRASFDKIERRIGFTCRETLEAGVGEIVDAIRAQKIGVLSIHRPKVQPITPPSFAHASANSSARTPRTIVESVVQRHNPAAMPLRSSTSAPAGSRAD
jgi:nucleoside-diphosphate-sugar epimerase